MEIIIADNAGFCFGVKRAVNTTDKQLNSPGPIYSYGELVHNKQVVDHLQEKGLNTIDNYKSVADGSIIIRSHGVPKAVIEDINNDDNLKLIDVTCPYVTSVHKKVEDYCNKGYDIIIVGDDSHPEVIGINGWCNNKAFIINSMDDVISLPFFEKVLIVSQTTNTLEKFEMLSGAVKERSKESIVSNTICNATKVRQESAAQVAKNVDAMVVIGGKNSSNTKKLAEISSKYCKNVFLIETIKDLSLQDMQKFNKIGITAGASTPDWIIKEAVTAMENLDKNEMMEAIESSFTKIHRGEIVKGTVLYVTEDEIMVNINYKSDGIINRDEVSNDPDVKPKDAVKVGDEIDVYIIKHDDGEGNVVLSLKRVAALKNWDIVEEIFNNKSITEARVLNAVKGGLTVLVNGVDGFMPASHASLSFESDLSKFKGQTVKVRVIDFDKDKRRIIVSKKVVDKEELEKKQAEVWENLEVDKMIVGTVQRLTDFGAFVDLGGVDGLIHVSDLSWNRVKHPSEVLKEGDKVEVMVLSLDKAKNRISLGLKQTIQEPWTVFKNNVSIGDVVEGKVVNLLDFGAFVRLESGVDGLLHVSQISKEHVNKPSDVLKIGDTIEVAVIEVNEDERRISLSAKQAAAKDETPAETEEKPEAEEVVEIKNEDLDTTIGDIINKK